MNESDGQLAGSFRDPSGFVYRREGTLYRQVNRCYRDHYDMLLSSGLYESLVGDRLLIRHQEVEADRASDHAYRTLQPERLPFVSYPYEWCFSQLRDAALVTLAIQRRALQHGMTLKDASAYNVQFYQGGPILIDTLSFERHEKGQPWVAYRQFCQHFLAPLALMAYRDVRLSQLLRVHLDGIPLDLASRLLPARTRLSLALAVNIHLHARSQKKHAGRAIEPHRSEMSMRGLLGLLDNLESGVRGLRWRPKKSVWSDYYDENNYESAAFQAKKELVIRYLEQLQPKTLWDLGANTGMFSRLAAGRNIDTIAFDFDPLAVERNYTRCRAEKQSKLLPLVMDLANPSPGLGWEHLERLSLAERGPTDIVMALALVHHLAIGNNLPLNRLAEFFARVGRALIVEFVPKEDSQTQRLLASRQDVFPEYTREFFVQRFSEHFEILASHEIAGSARTIYLMERRSRP